MAQGEPEEIVRVFVSFWDKFDMRVRDVPERDKTVAMRTMDLMHRSLIDVLRLVHRDTRLCEEAAWVIAGAAMEASADEKAEN